MKVVAFVLPFGRSHLVRTGNLPHIVIRASGCAAVGLLCFLSAFRAWSADCVSPPAGLVAWWPGQGHANDIGGTNNGVLEGGAAFAAGEVGQAFSFNGTNSYVEVPDSPTLRLTNELTIEFWVRRQDLQANDAIIEKGGDWTGGVQNYGVTLTGTQYGNDLAFLFAGGTRHSISITDLNWHHIAVVARNGDADPTFYVDGVQQPVTYRQGPGTLILYPSTAPLHIGAQVDPISGWYYYSKALVDEVSIYSRALAVAEIQAIYNAGSAGKCVPPPNCIPPPSGLVAWWPGGTNANDMAGTNNGTLLNGASFAPGEVGSAFSFNGSNQCVQIPYSQTLIASNYSVEAWVNPLVQVSDPINEDLIFAQNYGCLHLVARTGNSGVVIAFGFGTSHVTFHWVVSTNEMPIGQFSHLVGTWDGTTLRLYVNGVFNAQSAPGASPVDSGCPFFIGGFYAVNDGSCNYVGQFFNGLIDEVSYFNRALSGAEIQSIYNAGSAGKCHIPIITSQPHSQVGYWGKSVILTVTTAGTAPLSYQWLQNGTPIQGATGSSLVLTNLQLTNAGDYSVVVTNAYGSATSGNAYLTVNPAGVSLALYSGITIDGVVGLTYGIQYSTDLSNTNGWRGMANVTLGVPTELWFDVQPASQPQRYYRVLPGPISVP